ncbi:hypothetical protein [Thalassotalea marina]|uniref:Uncharacterized protein n=1 Tax=Thalassotalea marina TaxID=1673741 RepID=A0A919EK38_9GAMM|nr:hypothetical protein [Thalassotalea marina]GHF93568.1 hypothetical protein GCM10017161_22510 [Thalassotalea marina]
MSRLLLIIFAIVAIQTKAETYIGQWYLSSANNQSYAQTRDGDSQLRLEVAEGKVVAVRLILDKFSKFGEHEGVLEYSSPKYGLIRTTKYRIEQGEVVLTDPFEVHSFVDNLINISTHLMFAENNFGNSFKDRKLTIAYLDQSKLPQWRRSSFSTVEIDEVLAELGVSV